MACRQFWPDAKQFVGASLSVFGSEREDESALRDIAAKTALDYIDDEMRAEEQAQEQN